MTYTIFIFQKYDPILNYISQERPNYSYMVVTSEFHYLLRLLVGKFDFDVLLVM